MNKEIDIHTDQIDGFCTCACSKLSDYLTINIHKATILTGSCFFIVRNHRELVSILPKLIISSLNKKLLIEPTETTKRACNDLTVLSCDLHLLLKVVSVSGITMLVNKSI